MSRKTLRRILEIAIPLLLIIVASVAVNRNGTTEETTTAPAAGSIMAGTSVADSGVGAIASLDTDSLPVYTGSPYVEINGNQPDFLEKDLTTESFEYYGPLDYLGRCTACFASIGKDLMPTEKRGNISSVKPTGWHSSQYDNVDGGSLYNRSHLIAYMLTGENANERNLITGTRYMNATGMLPFEESVGNYVRSTGNHVLYRVTPVFVGDELVARGVQMEAISVEDNGDGICFNVYCFNVQPGIEIDYLTGDNHLAAADEGTTAKTSNGSAETYVLNTKSKKFHKSDCPNADTISAQNKKEYTGTRDELIDEGYTPCGQCQP